MLCVYRYKVFSGEYPSDLYHEVGLLMRTLLLYELSWQKPCEYRHSCQQKFV